MNTIERLVQIADRIDAKGLHSVATQIDEILALQEFGPIDDSAAVDLDNLIKGCLEPLSDLVKVASTLDNKGLVVLADKVDKIIELEALKTQSAIDAILSIYKMKHEVRTGLRGFCKTAGVRKDNTESKCPFGLPIPTGCRGVGMLVMEMDEGNAIENNQLFDNFKPGQQCPFAAEVLESQKAVNCNHGTPLAGIDMPELYHGSPIYPKLFEGFNTVNLDRSYQPTDFSNYSIYGEFKGFCRRGQVQISRKGVFKIVKLARYVLMNMTGDAHENDPAGQIAKWAIRSWPTLLDKFSVDPKEFDKGTYDNILPDAVKWLKTATKQLEDACSQSKVDPTRWESFPFLKAELDKYNL